MEGKKATTPLRNARALRTKFVNTSFKSPMRAKPTADTKAATPEDLRRELDGLLQKEREIDKEIVALVDQGYSVEELDWHIEKLHEYNEVKDAAQLVLGQLAVLEGTTVREMHQKYDLPLED